MSNALRLTLVRAVHTAIYVIMVAAILVVVAAGVTGATGPWLWVALGLVGVEVAVFAGSGMKCPLTAVAVKYGADAGAPADTFIPERLSRHTLAIFGPLIALGVLLLGIRWLGAGQ